MSQQQESKLVLELGQVIQIISPLNANLHEKISPYEFNIPCLLSIYKYPRKR